MRFLLLVLSSTLFIPVLQVYAWNGNEGVDLGFQIKKGFQWFTETIQSDPVQKQKVILSNMAGWQKEKETLIQQNKPVPAELEKIITEKKQDIEQIKTESTTALSGIIDSITISRELGKIHDYVSTFHKLRTNQIADGQRESTIITLETDTNNLDLAKKYCTHVSVNDVLAAQDPYEKIKSYCTILNTIPKEMVTNSLGEL